jgi:hypothetical protein
LDWSLTWVDFDFDVDVDVDVEIVRLHASQEPGTVLDINTKL